MASRAQRSGPYVRADRAAAQRARHLRQLRRAVHRHTGRRGISQAAGARRGPGVRRGPGARVGEPGLSRAARGLGRLLSGIGGVRQPVAGVADGRRPVAPGAEHGAVDVHGRRREHDRPTCADGRRRGGAWLARRLPGGRRAHGTCPGRRAPGAARPGRARPRSARAVVRGRAADRGGRAQALPGGQVAGASAGVRPVARHIQGLPRAVHGRRGRGSRSRARRSRSPSGSAAA